MKQFKVSLEDLRRVLGNNKDIFEGNYIAVVSNNSKDGNSGIQGNSFMADRRNIYRFAHAIFSGNPNDWDHFLGKPDKTEEVREQCGKLMPCIHGSDAHKVEDIGKVHNDRYTWIKAELSFNGLKQIIHEPEDRVIIQAHHPDTKINYNIIESVSFEDGDSFDDSEITLNSGLNTIIGGKSSGKSLLLYKIAQAISPDQIRNMENEELWSNNYKGSNIDNISFTVNWRNGAKSNKENYQGQVTYIPQMYINQLSEDISNSQLQNKIREVLIQSTESRDVLENNNSVIHNMYNEIDADINLLFDKLEEKEQLKYEEKNFGSQESIKDEIMKLDKSIQEKVKKSNLNETEQSQMAKLESKETLLNHKKETNEKNKESNEFAIDQVYSLSEGNNKDLDKIYTSLPDSDKIIINNLNQKLQEDFSYSLNKLRENKQLYINKQNDIEANIEKVKSELKPYLDKFKEQQYIKKLRESLNKEKEKEKNLKNLQNQIVNKDQEISETKESIFSKLDSIQNRKTYICDYFNYDIDGISLNAFHSFEHEKFQNNFLTQFNRKGRISNIFYNEDKTLFDSEDNFIVHSETLLNDFRTLFEQLLAKPIEELKLKKGYTKKQVIKSLFKSYNNVYFDLSKDDESIQKMSPGKRGLVIIQLFLSLSEETHPILIDQPEDNLDNRTISTELVKYIKTKKLERQIIMVTHNANLVVLTDSENVIVANQDKQLEENECHQFEYITGALECSFDKNGSKMSDKGIRSHVFEILEGGKQAFKTREKKYSV